MTIRRYVKIPIPVITNFSQNVTEPSKGISYPVSDLCRRFTILTGPCAYTLHSSPIPPTDGTNSLCDLSHTFHKQVTNVSQHVFVIPLWGILTSPLSDIGHHLQPPSATLSHLQPPLMVDFNVIMRLLLW